MSEVINEMISIDNLLLFLSWHEGSHHTTASGFKQIAKYLADQRHHRQTIPNPKGSSFNPIIWWLRKRTAKPWYNKKCLFNEWYLGRVVPKGAICHLLYGEDQFYYLGAFAKFRKFSLMATYHQPPAKLAEVDPNTKKLRNLDAITVVTSHQLPYFQNVVGKERVFLVPHGIDTKLYQPSEEIIPEKTCIFVGQWLRDFDTMREIIKILNHKCNRLKFIIVTLENKFGYFEDLKNVTLKANIPVAELVDAYKGADLLLLPITDCTANNTILEAAASGIPIVTNDVGGVRDYVDDNCALFFPQGDVEGMANGVLRLIDDEQKRSQMGAAARQKMVDNFSWPIVAQQMIDVYKTLS